MAETDLGRMNEYKSIIKNVGQRKGVDPALIAGIISRASRAGNTIKSSAGWGDYDQQRQAYNCFGLMQVDVNPNGGGHTTRGVWDSEEHLSQATFILRIRDKFPGWDQAQQLKGGIAAYNQGDGNVHSYHQVDAHTTGGDYANDVTARAQWYKEHGY